MYKYKSLQESQLPLEHLSFLQNLLIFIITKYLKQEVDDNLSICIDEHNPCGLSITGDIKMYQCHKDVSMSCDQKVMMLLTPVEECPINFYQGVAFTGQI